MRKLTIALLVLAAACGGSVATTRYTLVLHNATDRKIDEVFVYAPSAADHGASRGSLAPYASMQVDVAPGGIEVMAISELIHVGERTRDRPSASQVIEVRDTTKVVFFDLGRPPPGVDLPGVFGIAFRIPNAVSEPPQ